MNQKGCATIPSAADYLQFRAFRINVIGVLWHFNRKPHGVTFRKNRSSELPAEEQRTLALIVLKTPEAVAPRHRYGIARRIGQTSGGLLAINHGTLYRLARAGRKVLLGIAKP